LITQQILVFLHFLNMISKKTDIIHTAAKQNLIDRYARQQMSVEKWLSCSTFFHSITLAVQTNSDWWRKLYVIALKSLHQSGITQVCRKKKRKLFNFYPRCRLLFKQFTHKLYRIIFFICFIQIYVYPTIDKIVYSNWTTTYYEHTQEMIQW
jgi:hypothetical protein